MLVSLLQVASILVHLARLSLLRIISDIKVNNDLCRSHLVRGKRLVNDSIRYSFQLHICTRFGFLISIVPFGTSKLKRCLDTKCSSVVNCLNLCESMFRHGRIAEKILNPSREDQKKPKNAFGIELERIAATGILVCFPPTHKGIYLPVICS